ELMSRRAYLATGTAGLRALHDDGVLSADLYQAYVPASEDEEVEYAAMQEASEHAQARFGTAACAVVAADQEAGSAEDPPTDVGIAAVVSGRLGPDLSWYAVQERPSLL